MVQYLQINLHHSKAASAALLTRLETGKIDIVLIQEPWIVGNNICGLSTATYKLFHMKEWKVGTEHSFSDHRYVEFTISLECPPPENIRNLRRTNWGYYKKLLDRNLNTPPTQILDSQELENIVNTFTDICGEAIKKACPSRTVKTKHKPPWWNTTLAALKSDCRSHFNKAKYSNSEASWNTYHTKLSQYKKEIRISKRREWANFCSSIESTAEASRLRRILAKSPATVGYLKTNEDTWTGNSQKTLEILVDTHFPKNTQAVENLHVNENLDEQSIVNISNPECINGAINSFKPFKSPGPDGKPSQTSPKDFRPISLSSFLLKTLERLIDTHIRLTTNPSLLSNAQYAYRKGRSTDTALHSLVSCIERGFHNKEYSLAAFLDIEGAFNNVTPTAITGAMTELGIERPIVGLIHTILTSRVVYSTMGSAQSTKNVSRGTPRGGVKLLSLLEEAGTKVVAYADDVVILMQGKFPQTLCNLMETALSTLSSNQAKYLGVILDKKLLWAENIADRTRKAAIALFACKTAIGRKWGFSPGIVLWLYTAIVRPILLYGNIVWWHSLEKNCNLKNLHKIQRSAELCINYVPQIVSFEKRYKVLIPTRTDWDHLPHQIENAVNIYTDGSKLNLQNEMWSFLTLTRLPDHCSVYQAEVMAIQEA
nr:uncharacterized protein LOC123002812 [Drosophila takahashii]